MTKIYSHPLVSIGMPILNGEHFLRQALDSLLAQDYEHFEIYISDNASTDHTGDICQEYVMRDKRIRYTRNTSNMGAVANFNTVFNMTSGPYFLWATDHDLWEPNLISRCMAVLEKEPEVVLAYPQTRFIDLEGKIISEIIPEQIDTRRIPALHRYKCLLWNLAMCTMIYGLFRRSALVRTAKFQNILWPDYLLMAELALIGTFAQCDEKLFYLRRTNADEWEDEDIHIRRCLTRLDPASAEQKYAKSANYLYRELRNAHLQALVSAPLSVRDKLDAARETIMCFKKRFGVQTRFSHMPGAIKRLLIPCRYFNTVDVAYADKIVPARSEKN